MDCSPIVLAHEPSFHIGSAEFRPPTREIIFDGEHAVLEPRVMQLLVALRRAEGSVVTKDELARACWNGRVVGDDAINRVVSRLRGVASRQAAGEFVVQTITKVGYRLVATGMQGSPPPITSGPDGFGLNRRQLVVGAAAAVGVAAAGTISWQNMAVHSLPEEAKLLVADAESAFKTDDPDQRVNAVSQLRRAAELAPGSALVWGMLALGYMKLITSSSASERAGLRVRGVAAAQRSLSIDPDQPDARAAIIHTLQRFGNWSKYEDACRSALRSHSHHLELNYLLAGLLAQVGRFSEMLPLAEHCMVKAPLQPRVYLGHAMTLNELGRIEEADAVFGRALQLWPRHVAVWASRFYFLLFNHRPDEALAMVRHSSSRPTSIDEDGMRRLFLQAEALAIGDRARTLSIVAEMERAVAKGLKYPEDAAMFAAHAGETDAAFRIVGMIFGRGSADSPTDSVKPERDTYFLFWRAFAGGRRDPRFGPLISSLGLTTYWERSGTFAKVAGAPMIASVLRSTG